MSTHARDLPHEVAATALSYSTASAGESVITSSNTGILAGASQIDMRYSTLIDASSIINNLNPPVPEPVTVTYNNVLKLVHKLIASDGDREDSSLVSAAEELLRIARTSDGPDYVITAIVDAHAVARLVQYLTHEGALRKNTITIFAYILRSQQTWDAALDAHVIPLLVACLSDTVLDTQIDAACALTNITGAERGKKRAAEAGAMLPLVVALSRPSYKLKKMAVRVVRNITSVDSGRRAAYESNAVQPLVALLDSRSRDFHLQYDAAKALTSIASFSKAARKAVRKCGVAEKVKRFSSAPEELQVALDTLLDKI